MGCVHDEAGSWGSGGEPQDIGVTSVIASCPVNSGDMWHRSSVPSHGLGLRWYNAVVRAFTAGLTGLGTPWDACMMRRGRGAVEGSLKTSV